MVEVNLPGIGDTVIKQAVPPGGDLCIALGQVEACDLPKRGRLGCAIFGSGGLRSRVPLTYYVNQSSTQCNDSMHALTSVASAIYIKLMLCCMKSWIIPYSGKLSREKTFTNFAIFQPSAKVFSTKF